MRFIRRLLLLAVLGVVGLMAYNYWSGSGFTLQPPANSAGIDAEAARQRGAALAGQAAATASAAATKIEGALGEGALTAKIKSKMALDDLVKARTINVDTSASVVTLSGLVESAAEHDRAVLLAKETEGVTSVVDRLVIKKP